MDQEERNKMSGKIHFLVLGLLVVYGVALAAVSYAVFNKNKTEVLPKSAAVKNYLETNAVNEVSLDVDSTGRVTLDANGQTVGGFQGKLVLPYNPKFATLRAVVSDPAAKILLNKTEVDKTSNQITVSLVLVWEKGFSPEEAFTVATLNIPATGLTFDRRYTKVIPFGIDSGNLPIKFSI